MSSAETVPARAQDARTTQLALVINVRRQPFQLAPFWQRLVEELDEVDIVTEVIGAEVRPLVTWGEPPPGRRALVPSLAFVPALIRSPAAVFLCMEYSFATLVTAVAARLTGRRTIVFQEHRGRTGVSLRGWERAYRRLLGGLAHGLIANTDGAYVEIADVLGVDRRKVFRATLLVPPERAYLSRDPSDVPEPVRRPVFLFVGQLLKRKNVDGLLDAAIALRARGFDFEVWIVGEGPQRHALETKAVALTNDGFVRFLGPRPNTAIGSLYELADVFVMPSLVDYRSVAVLEALRFGTPVIVSVRDGNAGDFVRHEVTGLVFDPAVPGALEASMERAITDEDTRRELGQRASAVLEEHTPQTAAAALRDILAAVKPA